jgi:hypothetical protein
MFPFLPADTTAKTVPLLSLPRTPLEWTMWLWPLRVSAPTDCQASTLSGFFLFVAYVGWVSRLP